MCTRGSKSQPLFRVLPDFGVGRNLFCNTFELPMLEAPEVSKMVRHLKIGPLVQKLDKFILEALKT